MKQRVITSIVLVAIVLPLILLGTYFTAALGVVILALGSYEFLDIKRKSANLVTDGSTEKKVSVIPYYVYVICFAFSLLLVFDISAIPGTSYTSFYYTLGLADKFGINIVFLALFVIVLCACSVFDERFDITDAFYAFGTTVFLSLGIKGCLYIRSLGGKEHIYLGVLSLLFLLFDTCFTDIFALFGGMAFKKILKGNTHKLNERISPKKTVEGSITGTIFGTGLSFVYAILIFPLFDDMSYPWFYYLILAFALSIAGQIGDLILSAVKRHFKVKDFSKLLPGHGGILDRIDSLLVNAMVMASIVSMLAEVYGA